MTEIRFETDRYDRDDYEYDIRVNLTQLGEPVVADSLKAIDAAIQQLKATLTTAVTIDREIKREANRKRREATEKLREVHSAGDHSADQVRRRQWPMA